MEKFISSILGEERVIDKIVKKDNFLYVFHINKKYLESNFKDNYIEIGGEGPLLINLDDKSYSFISESEFSLEHYDPEIFGDIKEMSLNTSSIVNNIEVRSHINFEDIGLMLKNEGFESIDEFYIFSYNPLKNIEVEDYSEGYKIISFLVGYLKKINANYSLVKENHLLIEKEIIH